MRINFTFTGLNNSVAQSRGQVVSKLYPSSSGWPEDVRDLLGSDEIFLCPESSMPVVDTQMNRLRYVRDGVNIGAYFATAYTTHVNNNGVYKFPRGPIHVEEPKGDYPAGPWDYYIIGDYGCVDLHQHDGLFRIHDSINGRIKVELIYHSCQSPPSLFYVSDNQLLFEDPTNPGKTIIHTSGDPLVYWIGGGATNYGINKLVNKPQVKGDTIVLLDLDTTCADPSPDNLANLVSLLSRPNSARHRGRMNVLFSDQSVARKGPSELDPVTYFHLWNP